MGIVETIMLRLLAILFIISIFIPVEFYTMAGSLRIETYRVVLAGAFIYTLLNFRVALERADIVDVLLACLVALAFASFWYNHDLAKAMQSTGIYALETLGAFYLARMFITTPERFYMVNLAFVVALGALTLLTVYEAFSHQRILHEIAKQITGHDSLDYRLYTNDYMRAGIMRATSIFEHPILYGTLLATFFPFALLHVMRTRRTGYAINLLGLVASMILTFSSAPLLSFIFQAITAVLVKFWNTAKRLWVAVLFSGLAGALIINAASDRGFFGILISYLTFNPNTGYFRMLQWQYTADDIMNSPILGIAHNDWTRPYWMAWMGNSIDSFWLLLALQHGLFAALLLLIASFYAAFNILNLIHKHHDRTRWMVVSWLLSFMSLILIGFTVDYFGKLQPMFFFMLGAISWAKYYPLWNYQAELLEDQADQPSENGSTS